MAECQALEPVDLREILPDVVTEHVRGTTNICVSSVCFDTRSLKTGALFAAFRGTRYDDHRFVEQAVSKGARAIFLEEDISNLSSEIISIKVSDTRAALPRIAANSYHHPSLKMKVADITGTNGKITTACLIKHICDFAKLSCGYIGTWGNQIMEQSAPCAFTTPDSTIFQGLLAHMYGAGCQAVALETSTHGLELKRIYDVEFDAVIFTNLLKFI